MRTVIIAMATAAVLAVGAAAAAARAPSDAAPEGPGSPDGSPAVAASTMAPHDMSHAMIAGKADGMASSATAGVIGARLDAKNGMNDVSAVAPNSASADTTNTESDGKSHFGTDPRRIGLGRTPKDASFSPDGKHLYVTDTDDTLHVIDANSGKELTALDGAQFAVTDDSGKRLFLAEAEGETSTIITVFDAKSFEQVSSMDIGLVSSWQVTHDGTRIITTEDEYSGVDYGDKSAVHIFDTASGKETKTFDVTHEMHPPTVASPKDGKSYIVAGTDGSLQRVDAKTFKVTGTATIDASGSGSFAPVLRPADDHGDIVYAYDWFGPGLRRVHLDSGDVDRIDTDGAGLLFLSTYGKQWFATLSQADDGTLVIAPLTGTGSNDTPKLGEPVEFAPGKGIMPAGSMDGSVIYYETFESGSNPTLYVYDAANRQMLEPLTLPSIPDGSGSGGDAAPSWDGSRLAVPDRDGRQVLVYDLVRRTPATAKGDDAGTGDSGDSTGRGSEGDTGDGSGSGRAGRGSSDSSGAADDASAWFTKPWVWILVGMLAVVIAIAVPIVVVVARSRANKRVPAMPYAQMPSSGAPYGAAYGAAYGAPVSVPAPYGAPVSAPAPNGVPVSAPASYGVPVSAPAPYGAPVPPPVMPPRPRTVPPAGMTWPGAGGRDEPDRPNRPR